MLPTWILPAAKMWKSLPTTAFPDSFLVPDSPTSFLPPRGFPTPLPSNSGSFLRRFLRLPLRVFLAIHTALTLGSLFLLFLGFRWIFILTISSVFTPVFVAAFSPAQEHRFSPLPECLVTKSTGDPFSYYKMRVTRLTFPAASPF